MRLIDADALLKKKDIITINDGNRASVVGIVYEDDIEEAPTVDAVKHGEWISEKYPLVKCSICGKTMILAYDNYCPNCGAKMDGKEKRDE